MKLFLIAIAALTIVGCSGMRGYNGHEPYVYTSGSGSYDGYSSTDLSPVGYGLMRFGAQVAGSAVSSDQQTQLPPMPTATEIQNDFIRNRYYMSNTR